MSVGPSAFATRIPAPPLRITQPGRVQIMRQIPSPFVQTMTVAFVVLLAGCGKNPASPIPVQPHTPVPSPDVKLVELHFPYRSISIGGGEWAGPGIKRSPRGASREATLFLGVGDTPQGDFWFAGRFPNLGAQITLNGQSWWSRTVSCASQDGYEDHTSVQAPMWTPPDSGTYVFAATLDPGDLYPELDETNNSDTLVVHALVGNLGAMEIELDQTVNGFVVRADTIHVGAPVHVIVRSWCQGAYPAYRMRLDQNGEALLDSVTSCSSDAFLFPGFNNPELDWVARDPGVHTFTLVLDPDHATRESSLNDNTVTASLVVVP